MPVTIFLMVANDNGPLGPNLRFLHGSNDFPYGQKINFMTSSDRFHSCATRNVYFMGGFLLNKNVTTV